MKPGGYDSPIGHRPPHIHFDIRGQRYRTIAQMYFPEEASLNAVDQLYRSLGKGAGTSVALGDPGNPGRYSWDAVLMEGGPASLPPGPPDATAGP